MNVPNRLAVPLLIVLLLALIPGCSLLGFSAYPVAHLMTKDTKRVLEGTSTRGHLARELSKEVLPAHYLQPGDELLIEVVDFNSDVRLPADQQVMADGTIDLGKYGRVVVASKTHEQAETAVQRAIAILEPKPVAVNIRLIQPVDRYYVIGEVNSPGAYSLVGHETVLDAILEAGGLTARASACDLLLARPTDPYSCRVTLPVCYRAITQLGDTTTNYHLRPGDRIFVARQSICEEMMSYCRGAQTCDRCCARQVACRDPGFASQSPPEFVPPPIEMIAPEPLEENLNPDTAGEISEQPGEANSSRLAPLNDGSLNDGSLNDVTEEIPRGLLDGELDFGE